MGVRAVSGPREFAHICLLLLAICCICLPLLGILAFACFGLHLLCFACYLLHLLVFACYCLHLRAFVCICLFLLAVCLHITTPLFSLFVCKFGRDGAVTGNGAITVWANASDTCGDVCLFSVVLSLCFCCRISVSLTHYPVVQLVCVRVQLAGNPRAVAGDGNRRVGKRMQHMRRWFLFCFVCLFFVFVF